MSLGFFPIEKKKKFLLTSMNSKMLRGFEISKYVATAKLKFIPFCKLHKP